MAGPLSIAEHSSESGSGPGDGSGDGSGDGGAPAQGRPMERWQPPLFWYRCGVGLLLALLLAMGLYGAGGPFVWGHYGYHAGEYSTRARHTMRHGTILPSNAPGFSKPDTASYYLHHPILTHQLVTLTLIIFGQHEVAVRAAALISTVASLLLLVALVRRQWGRWQALLSGALFVLVPIHVWFAAHIDPGLPGIACLLGFFLCYFPWVESGRWSLGLLGLCCLMLSGLFEWSPYLAVVPVGLHALAIGLRRRGRFLAWVPLLAIALLAPVVLHALIVIKTGHIPEMKESYLLRSGGPTLWRCLVGLGNGARELFSVPLLISTGVWLLMLVRRAVRRQLLVRDLLPVSFAFSLVIYAMLFRNGVLVHLYRLLYGGVLCAVAAIDFVEAAALLAAWWTRRRQPNPIEQRMQQRMQRAMIGATAALIAATLPFSALALASSRRLGGVPFQRSYEPGLRQRAFVKRMLSLTSPEVPIYVHQSFVIRKDLFFYTDRDLINVPTLAWVMARPAAERDRGVLMLIEPVHSPQELATLTELGRTYPIWRLGEYTLVDLRRRGVRELHLEKLAPPPPRSLWQRYWEGPYAHPIPIAAP